VKPKFLTSGFNPEAQGWRMGQTILRAESSSRGIFWVVVELILSLAHLRAGDLSQVRELREILPE
jgi:hypothetical protein